MDTFTHLSKSMDNLGSAICSQTCSRFKIAPKVLFQTMLIGCFFSSINYLFPVFLWNSKNLRFSFCLCCWIALNVRFLVNPKIIYFFFKQIIGGEVFDNATPTPAVLDSATRISVTTIDTELIDTCHKKWTQTRSQPWLKTTTQLRSTLFLKLGPLSVPNGTMRTVPTGLSSTGSTWIASVCLETTFPEPTPFYHTIPDDQIFNCFFCSFLVNKKNSDCC